MSCGESSPGSCHCDYVYRNAVISEEGTYTTTGTTLAMVSSGSSSDSSPEDYCVQGNTLLVHFTDSSSGSKVTMAFAKQ